MIKLLTLLFVISLISGCKDHSDLELKDLRHPDQDTIFFNLYTNVYSEDLTLQPIRIGNCLPVDCESEGVIINVPRVYFHSTIRALDDRSFFTKQFRNVPRNNWPEVSTIESLELMLSCKGEQCISYPEACDKSKLKCAKPLRPGFGSNLPVNSGLVRIDFLFYEQKKQFSIFNPRFVWLEEELIETLPGGYKRYSSTKQFKKEQGGIYLAASDEDEFDRIQCEANFKYCEYLFYLDLNENFAHRLYKDKDRKLLVKADFENLYFLENDFLEVNKRVSKIKQNLCQFIPCK